VRFIDFRRTRARYLRLEVVSTWAAATVPTYYKQLRIDEMRVGWRYPRGRSHHHHHHHHHG
jgi:hypothetical protein